MNCKDDVEKGTRVFTSVMFNDHFVGKDDRLTTYYDRLTAI